MKLEINSGGYEMITGKPIKIISMGTFLPPKISSSEIEKLYNIPHGWAYKYSGVLNRHHVTDQNNGYMGARAAEQALERANMTLKDIDLLISAGCSFDYPLPNQASIIKSEMKDGNQYDVPAIDIDSTCLSFITAFDFAARILDGKSMKNILIVSSEISSHGLNYENWETTTLFGDGAAAAIICFDGDKKSHFIKGMHKTYSEGAYHAIIEGGGNKHFFKTNPYNKELHSFKMNGKNLLRLAKNKFPGFVDSFFEDLPFTIEETDVIVPHQVSKMGLYIFNCLYNFKEGQVKESLSQYGNCIAASVPLTLADCIYSDELKRGDLCLLIGTSAGFTIGAVLIRY